METQTLTGVQEVCRPASELLTVGLAAGGLACATLRTAMCASAGHIIFNNDQKYLDFPYQQCTGYNSAYVRYGSTVRYAVRKRIRRVTYGFIRGRAHKIYASSSQHSCGSPLSSDELTSQVGLRSAV